MYFLAPDLDIEVASTNLAKLLNTDIGAKHFRSAVRRLENRFSIYIDTCQTPFIASGLIVTPEIRRQSELYLPIAEISKIFNRFYNYALTYPPVLSSTPFHKALSWADVFAALPPRFQFSPNPARLLKALLSDQELLTEFLFASFMPRRFYGVFGRYPDQMEFLREWLNTRRRCGSNKLRCLDSACGTGEDSYALVNLFLEGGFAPEELQIEGWTLEPLEVWAAAHQRFPHDRQREAIFRSNTSRLFDLGYQSSIRYRCADLTNILCLPLWQRGIEGDFSQFDLILCNGLLGGPIISKTEELEKVVSNLAGLLASDGILLTTDNFHCGWKAKCRDVDLKAMLMQMGLKSFDAGEGVGGLKL